MFPPNVPSRYLFCTKSNQNGRELLKTNSPNTGEPAQTIGGDVVFAFASSDVDN
jgi:hypothetical protein